MEEALYYTVLGLMAKYPGDTRKVARKIIDFCQTLQLAHVFDGGAGSGNFNHAGRPGEVGGSAPSKGISATAKADTNKDTKITQNGITEVFPGYTRVKNPKKLSGQYPLTQEAKQALNTVFKPLVLEELFNYEKLKNIKKKDLAHILEEHLPKIENRAYVGNMDDFLALVSKGDANKMAHTTFEYANKDFCVVSKEILLHLNQIVYHAVKVKEHADLEGNDDFIIRRMISPVLHKGNIYVCKLIVKQFKHKRREMSSKVYQLNGNKDFGQYNLEIVKKISLENTAPPIKRMQPPQGTNNSIKKHLQKVNSFTLKDYLRGIKDDTGFYE